MSAHLIRERMALEADFLAENPADDPSEVGPLQLAVFAVRRLINGSVAFELSGSNLDRPDAAKYGTFADGTPRHAPQWYAAHGAATGIHEGLYGVLRAALMCPASDDEGHACIGGIGHDACHHDGEGTNW